MNFHICSKSLVWPLVLQIDKAPSHFVISETEQNEINVSAFISQLCAIKEV